MADEKKKGLHFDTTDAVIIGAAGLILTFLFYVEQQRAAAQAQATQAQQAQAAQRAQPQGQQRRRARR